MKELLTELRNKVLYLKNTEELSAKGELILLHKLNALEKQFAISGVVGSLPTEEQIDDKVGRVAASTWGDYGAGYIDGTRNGASWVIDVVNGEDK